MLNDPSNSQRDSENEKIRRRFPCVHHRVVLESMLDELANCFPLVPSLRSSLELFEIGSY